MAERERAYLGQQLVTVIEGKIGRRGHCTIRNEFGFIERVPAKDLTRIDKREPEAVLRYGEPDN